MVNEEWKGKQFFQKRKESLGKEENPPALGKRAVAPWRCPYYRPWERIGERTQY